MVQTVERFFFMDTFFVTRNTSGKKKGRKTTSERGHTCCQLFVTDKGFIYVVLMKTKKEVPQIVKQFAKEIGAPGAIICEGATEQTSGALREFCHKISTTLWVLEEGTPWSNKAELYIELLK